MARSKKPAPASRVTGIDHISIRVSDYERSRAFYGGLFAFLGFEVSDEYPSTIGWTNGSTRFWIAPAEGRRTHRIGDVGLHHYAFQLRSRRTSTRCSLSRRSGRAHRRSRRGILRGLLRRLFLDPDGLKLEGMRYGELTAKRKRKSQKKKG